MRQIVTTWIALSIMLFFSACADSITESCESVFADKSPGGTQLMRARFGQIQDSVLNLSCAFSQCHAGTQQPTMSAGNAYNNLVGINSSSGLAYIEPGEPTQSYLYLKITGDPAISGERMPRDASPLATAKIDSIRQWILNGALNN